MERIPPASRRLPRVDVGFPVYLICILFVGRFWFQPFPPERMSPRDGVCTASHLPPGSAESRGPSISHESGLFEAERRAHSFPDSACLCV